MWRSKESESTFEFEVWRSKGLESTLMGSEVSDVGDQRNQSQHSQGQRSQEFGSKVWRSKGL